MLAAAARRMQGTLEAISDKVNALYQIVVLGMGTLKSIEAAFQVLLQKMAAPGA